MKISVRLLYKIQQEAKSSAREKLQLELSTEYSVYMEAMEEL